MKSLTVLDCIIFAILVVVAVAVAAFFIYGWITDCPGTAGYVSCAAME